MSARRMIIAAALLAGILPAQAPDLILSNGKIITVDERFTIAQAIAIAGDRINVADCYF
jgi:adenine deaminase